MFTNNLTNTVYTIRVCATICLINSGWCILWILEKVYSSMRNKLTVNPRWIVRWQTSSEIFYDIPTFPRSNYTLHYAGLRKSAGIFCRIPVGGIRWPSVLDTLSAVHLRSWSTVFIRSSSRQHSTFLTMCVMHSWRALCFLFEVKFTGKWPFPVQVV